MYNGLDGLNFLSPQILRYSGKFFPVGAVATDEVVSVEGEAAEEMTAEMAADEKAAEEADEEEAIEGDENKIFDPGGCSTPYSLHISKDLVS